MSFYCKKIFRPIFKRVRRLEICARATQLGDPGKAVKRGRRCDAAVLVVKSLCGMTCPSTIRGRRIVSLGRLHVSLPPLTFFSPTSTSGFAPPSPHTCRCRPPPTVCNSGPPYRERRPRGRATSPPRAPPCGLCRPSYKQWAMRWADGRAAVRR